MAEALVESVIENLGSLVKDQLAIYWGVDEQTEKLSSNLKAIRAVLRDAERKQITSYAVKDWLQKLTDAAYVLDDILDECSIHSTKMHSVDGHTSRLSRLHPKDILFRFHIGKRMRDITQRFHSIHEERLTFELRASVTETHAVDDDDWRQTSSVITEPILYGRDEDREKIVKFLLKDANNNEDLTVYPIVSTGQKERRETSFGSKTEENTVEGTRSRGVQNLPYPEYNRREEGRCFHCGGAYSPGHRCPDKNLRVVILAEDEKEGEDEEEKKEGESKDMENRKMELSLFSVGGLTQTNTMKLEGRVKGRKVLILIDSGASHSFISSELVADLELPVANTPLYCVKLGDGHKKQTSGCCKDIEVQLEEHIVKETFFLFELGGVDLILGMTWLASLGEVKVNWRTLITSFNIADHQIQIKGDPTLTKKVVTPNALLKETEIEAITLVWELGVT